MDGEAFSASNMLQGRTIASARELLDAGMTRSTLSRRVKAGEIVKLADAPGLFALPGRDVHAEEDVIRVSLRSPRGVMCLLTAMRLHGMPAPPTGDVWIGVASKGRPPKMKAPPIRVVHMDCEALAFGVGERWLDGVRVAVTTPAKTVADCFKYRGRVGMRAAALALRSCLEQGMASPEEIWAAASVDRVTAVVDPLLDALA